MPLRTILVHLNESEKTGVRLRIAANLARSRGARVTGVFARVTPAHQVGVVKEWPPHDYVAAAAASRTAFGAATEGLEAEWIDLNRGEEGEIIHQLTDLARHFDLLILGQTTPGDALTPPDLNEELIVHSGRPVLVTPHSGEFATVGERPIFAWSDSASSARGFADCVPLVLDGAPALVVALSKAGDEATIAYQKKSLALAVAHLAAHGIAAKAEQLALSDLGLMDALLNHASDYGADLLSIGAFGSKANRLFSRGGSGSRYMLKHMTLPVLFSH
jgi:nucleotide-binding universal stress UspA family protein